ncbi:transmembrane protein, putative [Medicago truncatula]|uniref:Transmembrane protein, putative n=1 Tax=Medicago truncatula TaxID=3880 RepID=A0A072TRN2_MEDTR|nr:transmembrane protein, putative [Medicago truncatula]
MDSGSIIIYLLLVSFVSPIYSFKTSSYQLENQTFQIEKFHKLKKTIKNRLQQINKPPIKTIQSSDGDIVDCVSVKREETNALSLGIQIILSIPGSVWLDTLPIELHLDFFRDRVGLSNYKFP